MGYATARKAAQENLQLLKHHGNDPVKMALYNISVALANLADDVEQDLARIDVTLSNVQAAQRGQARDR